MAWPGSMLRARRDLVQCLLILLQSDVIDAEVRVSFGRGRRQVDSSGVMHRGPRSVTLLQPSRAQVVVCLSKVGIEDECPFEQRSRFGESPLTDALTAKVVVGNPSRRVLRDGVEPQRFRITVTSGSHVEPGTPAGRQGKPLLRSESPAVLVRRRPHAKAPTTSAIGPMLAKVPKMISDPRVAHWVDVEEAQGREQRDRGSTSPPRAATFRSTASHATPQGPQRPQREPGGSLPGPVDRWASAGR